MTLTLYGAPKTRVSMPRWYLEEKGIPYELVMLDLAAQGNRQPDFLAVNPFGKLPALEDDSVSGLDGQPLKLFESGAILQHLEDHHSGEQRSAAERSLTAQWLLFANATLAIALFVPSNREREFPRLMQELDRQMASGGPLVGDRWGAADCAVSAYLAYLPIFFPQEDLSPYPSIQALITSTRQRSAYRKVMGMD
ncbi:glutathione S-transferase family protein [Synechococcus sp. MIT S1220]|uniref:glutathione S-transferase family protein n=1 Tax=Synechococcus sp. MIT S1220 TaxID=3082549 RepID=UPI0039AFC2BC